MHFFAFLCCLSIASSARAAGPVNQLVVYPVTEAMPRNADFNVRVRIAGQKWQNLPAYLVRVAQGVDTRPPTQ